MAEPGKGPFREKSLERLSSPERLDQLLHVVDQKSWLPLSTLGVLLVVLFGWSVFGRIPVNVDGQGILVRPRKVVEVQSPGVGRLDELRVAVDEVVDAGAVIAVIHRPDLVKQLQLQHEKALQLTALSEEAEALRGQRTGLADSSSRLQQESLRDYIEEAEAVAERVRRLELESLARQRIDVEKQHSIARVIPDEFQELMEGRKDLEMEGIITPIEVATATNAYVQSLKMVASLEADLRALDARELEVEERYLDRLQRIADRTYEMQGLDVTRKEQARQDLASQGSDAQQIAEVNREIDRLEELYRQEGRIVAEQRGRILEINAVPGQVLALGQRVGVMAVDDPDSPLQSLTFFSVRDGKRLRPELDIRVTPDTVERERYGSIRGSIKRISPFPVTLHEVQTAIGNPVVAQQFIDQGFLIEVASDLWRDSETTSGFDWSSSDGPEIEISSGTTTTARVAIEQRRPITFVIPLLKSAFGTD